MSTTAEKMAVMAAHEAGKQIQNRQVGDAVWFDCMYHPKWDWADYEYRVRPKEVMRTVSMLCYLWRGELHWRSEQCIERMSLPQYSVRVPSEDKIITYAVPGDPS